MPTTALKVGKGRPIKDSMRLAKPFWAIVLTASVLVAVGLVVIVDREQADFGPGYGTSIN
jgi:predicted transcriptional regulator